MIRSVKEIDELMKLLPEEFRHRWCEINICACLGCTNYAGASYFENAGVMPPTKEEWLAWNKSFLEKSESSL